MAPSAPKSNVGTFNTDTTSSVVSARAMHEPPDAQDLEAAAWQMSQHRRPEEAPQVVPQRPTKRLSTTAMAAMLCGGLLVLLAGGFVLAWTLGHHGRGSEGGGGGGGAQQAAPGEGATTSAPAAAPGTGTTAAAGQGTTTAEPGSQGGGNASVPKFSGAHRCYNMYSQMSVNPLQVYKDNPDSDAYGYTQCRLCTNGTMSCTSLLHSGTSKIIASHIHLATGEDKDGSDGEGPPVINFCGSNSRGLILDGTEYTVPCEQWNADGAAHNVNMPGALVRNFNKGMTVADRVEDIAKRPEMYYFNFHTLASWNKWYPNPHGICRGEMKLTNSEP